MEKSSLKVMALAIAMVLFLAAGAVAQNNLLTNGDASQGLRGWTEPLGGNEWEATTISEVPPISGPYFYPKKFKGLRASGAPDWKARGGKYTQLMQTVSVPSSYVEGRTMTLSADARGWPGQDDAVILQVRCFDSSNKMLASKDSNYAQGGNWKKIKASLVVPSGTVKVEVGLFVHRLVGNAADGYIDNVSLTVQ
ncbi:MAG: hypothetical protein ILP18_10635 [Treponema sp.]|nr:hypothetical protein [Treponema sp.]